MWGGVMWGGATWAGLSGGTAAHCFGDASGFDFARVDSSAQEAAALAFALDGAEPSVFAAETSAFVYGTTGSRASVTGGDRKREGC